jgi:hypothetical protein
MSRDIEKKLAEREGIDPADRAMRSVTMQDLELTNFQFHIGYDPGSAYLQVVFWARDSRPGVLPIEQRGRKWRLSEHMTPSEIVRTQFMAVMAVVEHEVRELFEYRGGAIFGPHIDIEALLDGVDRTDKRVEL